MTRIHKALIIFLILFSILIIIFSTVQLSANLYQSHLETQREDDWESEVIQLTYLKGHTVGTNSCVGASTLKDVPLSVHYLEDSSGARAKDACSGVSISINNIKHGIMWVPIFKYFKFETNVPVKFEEFLYRPKGDSILVMWYRIHGRIKVTGKISINGFCSYKEARHLMVRSVLDHVYTSVRKEMDGIK